MITEREILLWNIIDDIDTATHAYAPEDSAFMAFLYKIIAKRFDLLVLDGNKLCEPENDKI